VRSWLIWIPVLLAAGIAGGIKFAHVRQDLAGQREAINEQWNAVSEALDRRAELVMELAESAKHGSRLHDRIVRDLSTARAALSSALTPVEKISANARISAEVAKLLASSEGDPTLRKDEEFQRVQDELGDQDNEVAVARRKYNESLERYNTSIQMFPDNVVAGVSRFGRIDAYFTTEGGPPIPKGQF